MKGPPERTDPFDMRGPGARLREAREAADISIDRIAKSLLLDPKIVEALEEDAFDRLPAPTFVRGYLRGYARVLGVPAAPILDMYDRHGFKPPPLGSEISETAQAHTSDIVVRIVTYAVAAVLVLLVGLWWHSQEDGGFGISADLFSGSSVPATDSPDGIDEALETAPSAGETSPESVAAASGEPPAVSRADHPRGPMFVERAAPGDIATAESAPTDPAGTETVSDPDPLTPQTSPALSPDAADGVTVGADITPQTTAAAGGSGDDIAQFTIGAGDDPLATIEPVGTEQTAEEEESDAATPQTTAAAGGSGDDIAQFTIGASDDPLATIEPTGTEQTAEGGESDAATPQTTAAAGGSGDDIAQFTIGASDDPLATIEPTGTEQTAEGGESDAATTQVTAVGDDSGAAEDAAADAGSQGADPPATTVEAADTATPIETEPAGDETSISPATRESADTGPDSAAGLAAARSGLVLEFVHESWVEVYDSERARLFFGLVQPGRVLDFDGARPFDVLLGFGVDVRVTIDGEAFDVTPYIKHGVARFKVGAAPSRDAETAATESAASAQPDLTEEPGESEQPEEAAEPGEATEPGNTAQPDKAEESGDTTVSSEAREPPHSSRGDRGP